MIAELASVVLGVATVAIALIAYRSRKRGPALGVPSIDLRVLMLSVQTGRSIDSILAEQAERAQRRHELERTARERERFDAHLASKRERIAERWRQGRPVTPKDPLERDAVDDYYELFDGR